MILSWPNIYYCALFLFTYVNLSLLQLIETPKKITTNKMRYATNRNANLPFDHMLELASVASSSPGAKYIYKTHPPRQTDKLHFRGAASKSLDDEDRSLLDKFYRDTRKGDPFQSDSFSTDDLWKSQENSAYAALTDEDVYKKVNQTHFSEDWTFDPDINEIGHSTTMSKEKTAVQTGQAGYSPTLRLLTSYDPIKEELFANQQKQNAIVESRQKSNRIVGATLYGKNIHTRPSVSSKSALDAIKMHDNLLKPPPRDGIVRVRMYYHRAIHDDVKLYGNGPWKYWGHGWGLEFGYDPKSDKNAKDFYQKGYTIERAFGRDFCRDKKNCRKPDPEFFNDPLKVGHYSRQQAIKSRTKY